MSERSTTALCGCERERDSREDQEPIWRDELTYSCTVDSLRRCSGWFLASGGNPNGATDSDGTGEGYLYGGSTHLASISNGCGVCMDSILSPYAQYGLRAYGERVGVGVCDCECAEPEVLQD